MEPTSIWTLPDLLFQRSLSSTAGLSFLDNDGDQVRSTSYTALYNAAQDRARRLLLSGIQPKGVNVVIASFENHYDHILLFWACCLGETLIQKSSDFVNTDLTLLYPSRRTILPHSTSPSRGE